MRTTDAEWDRALDKFQQIWGYSEFRSPQGEIVRSLLEARDTLVIMPTGGGKSICFQLPALLQSGLTLVVSPLVALMENQVQELRDRHLPAALLHNEVPAAQRQQTLRAIARQQLRLLYLSPETLLSPKVWQALCEPQVVINGLILDEAHCLVQWGETFRPAYQRLGMVRSALLQHKPAGSQIAVAAFTATADPEAQNTIQRVLQLQTPQIFLLNPYRANLHLGVQTVWTPRGRRQALLQFIKKYPQQTGLVYVRTRRDSETLATDLTQRGFQTAAYHAGLSAPERRTIEATWLSGQLQFVVCTSAFGMGINKPDVRWVIHAQAPMLLSEYVQEVGRAGRDGKPAQALTLVSEPTGWLEPTDRQRFKFFDEKARSQRQRAQALARQLPKQGEVSAVATQYKEGAIALAMLHSQGQLEWKDPFRYEIQPRRIQLNPTKTAGSKTMLCYLHTRDCRWNQLLIAFGFESLGKGCGHCDRCRP